MVGSCVEVGVAGTTIPLALLLGMRPAPRSDIERPFCLMEVTPEIWRRYDSKTLSAPRGRHKSYVTEYVFIEGHVLESHRAKLRTIQGATGVQLRDRTALHGYYVVIKGSAAEVMEALPMVESLANSSDSPTVAQRQPEKKIQTLQSQAAISFSTASAAVASNAVTTALPPALALVSLPDAPFAEIAEVAKPVFSWDERALQDMLRESATAISHNPSIVALEAPLALAPITDIEHACNAKRRSPSKEAWTTVPLKKQSKLPMGQSEKGLLHPLPQRARPCRKPVQISARGYECSRNPASGPRWAERFVEHVANVRHSSAEEDVDPNLACYLWDRSAARPKSDHCQPAQQWRQPLPRWGVRT